LLDDVFSELDPSRRGWLKEAVAGVGQTLLSSADSGPTETLDTQKVVRVDAGTLDVA
jgi:recombinational DNA repair ATPase RecF